MIRTGDHSDPDAALPSVLDVVPSLARCRSSVARSIQVLVRTTGLEDLGDGLRLFVRVVPVDRDVAGVGQLMRYLDEISVHLAKFFPEVRWRVAVVSGPPLGEVRIGEDQVAVTVVSPRSLLVVVLETRGPLLPEEGYEPPRIVVGANHLGRVVPQMRNDVVPVIGHRHKVEPIQVASALVVLVERLIPATIADRDVGVLVQLAVVEVEGLAVVLDRWSRIVVTKSGMQGRGIEGCVRLNEWSQGECPSRRLCLAYIERGQQNL